MKIKIGISAVCLLALAFVCASVPASADPVVYDNTGTGTYTTNAWSIFSTDSVTDSFTLSAPATIDGANFYAWFYPDDMLTSVNWAITDSAYGTVLASGTALGGPNTQVATGFGYYSIDEESISIPYVTLQAGTYYFELTGAQDGYDTGVWWDESDGPSTAAYVSSNGSGQNPSETFQITATPEPSSFLLLGPGMLLLAGLAMRRKLLA